jgi:hypothetical protein
MKVKENLHLIKEKKICLFYVNLDNADHGRFVYLSYSKMNEKWNVIHAIERLVYVLETHHFHTGIQVTKTNTNSNNNINTSRDNDS